MTAIALPKPARARRWLASLSAAVLAGLALTLAPATPALAATGEQDGLVATLTTDQSGYSVGESIGVSYDVRNTGTSPVSDVTLALDLPSCTQLASGQTTATVGALGAGDTSAFTATAQVCAPNLAGTGTAVPIAVLIVALACIAGGLALLGFSRAHWRRVAGRAAIVGVVSLALVGPLLPGPQSSAAPTARSFAVSIPVTLAGRAATVTLTVKYTLDAAATAPTAPSSDTSQAASTSTPAPTDTTSPSATATSPSPSDGTVTTPPASVAPSTPSATPTAAASTTTTSPATSSTATSGSPAATSSVTSSPQPSASPTPPDLTPDVGPSASSSASNPSSSTSATASQDASTPPTPDASASSPPPTATQSPSDSPTEMTDGVVTIDGTPKVGRDLTANTDEWGSPVSSLAYQWLRDGEAIEGATEETYVVHSTDLDANLSVQVTGTTPEGATQTGTSSPVTVVIADDDSPGATVGPEVIGDAGGVYANDRVSAVFPEGVVTGSATLTVSAGPAIGAVTWGDPDNPDATMTTIYAQPLRVEHDAPLAQPVEVSWDLSYLTATEQAGAVPVRWDESIGAWTVQYVPTTLENGILTATISEFSDWTVATSQFILKLFGKRSDPPTCDSSKPVPTWAENYGLPDNDEGMPVSACLEGDGDNVRVKMVNNRTYAQIVRLTSSTDPGAGYATMNPGIPELTLAAVFRYLFNGLVNWDQNKDQLNATAIILAPGATGAITLAQPTVTGTTNISLDTKVEPIAVFSDVFYMMSEAIVGDIVTPGDDWLPNQGVALSWQTQELLQVLHECVFQLQGDPDFGMLLDLIKGCANSEVLQQLLQAVLKNQVPGLDKVAKLILSFSSAAKAIEYANYYTYGVDVAAGLTLGQTNVVWIQAVGDSGPPGRWTATCDDVGADEWALYQDVIWRYPITGTTRPGAHSDFAATAKAAIKPLAACPTDFLEDLIDRIEEMWNYDQEAAYVINLIETTYIHPEPPGDQAGGTIGRYQFFSIPWLDTWAEAESYCEEQGGYLAAITSDEENAAVYALGISEGYTTAYFGYYEDDPGEWKWANGEVSNYTNWHADEPNDRLTEHWAEFYWQFDDGTWNDGNFGHGTLMDEKVFICEWDA